MHDEERSGRTSIIKDDLVEYYGVWSIHNYGTQQSFPADFPFLVAKKCCSELCARWVPEQLTPEHKAKRMESAWSFL